MIVSSASTRAWARRTGVFALAAALVCAWLLRVHHVEAFRFDDAFMTLRYARNLVEHGVLSFNVDDRVDGFTSPGWTLFVALLLKLGVNGERAMLSASVACGGLAMLAAVALARRLGSSWWWAVAVAGIGTLSTTGFLVWSASGMETAFVALMACVVLTQAIRSQGENGQLSSPTWLGAGMLMLCALSRPENALLSGLLMLYAFGQGSFDRSRSARARVINLAPLLVAGLVLLGLFAWHWSYYGYPLPNTYYAKAGSAELVARGTNDLIAFLRGSYLWLAPLAAIGLMLEKRARHDRSALACVIVFAIWFVAVCAQYSRAGGDHMGYHRFYQPLVPASCAVIAACMSRWLDRATTAVRHQHPLIPKLSAVVAVALGCLLLVSSHNDISTAWKRDAQKIRSSSRAVGQWRAAGYALAKRFPASTSMSIRAAGVIPYVTKFRSYDTLGLNNQDIAHNSPATGTIPGHQKEATAAQVVAWHPDIIVNHPVLLRSDRSGKPPKFFNPPEYKAAGYQYECLKTEPKRWLCYWVKRS